MPPTTPAPVLPAHAAFADPAMALSQHFTVAEFTRSDTAARLGLDNRLPAALLTDARGTAAMMEGIRAALCTLAGRDVPIEVTSGYRSPAVNKAVGSAATSDHPLACAVDWRAPSFGTPYAIAQALVAYGVDRLGIGQLIHEFGAWVHTSKRPQARALNRVITIDSPQGSQRVRVGVLPAA